MFLGGIERDQWHERLTKDHTTKAARTIYNAFPLVAF